MPRSLDLRAGKVLAALLLVGGSAAARPREPNAAYAERRERLRAQVAGPVVLFGYTGKENSSPSYLFQQEENFYYLTGHNEVGAALVLIPELPGGQRREGVGRSPREILFLPPHNFRTERWDGPRMGPDDPGIQEKTGFEAVRPFAELPGELEKLAATFPVFYTLLPGASEAGYPHARNWFEWLQQRLPQFIRRNALLPASPGAQSHLTRGQQG